MKEKKNIETTEKVEGAVSAKPEQIEAPAEKFSATRVVQPADAVVQASPEQDYKPKKVARKSVLKQEVAASVATGRDGGGGVIPTASIGGTNHGSYSGNEGTMAGSLAGSPITDASTRSSSRFGKKIDATAKKIDTMIAEQIILGFEESKPLAESKDSVQGYNGTYRNETMRLQKNQGAVPGSIRFARSVDEIFRDQIYFIAGQLVKQTGRDYGDYPTTTIDSEGASVPKTGSRGNFIPRSLQVVIDNNDSIKTFKFLTDDVSVVESDSTIVNAAATHALTHVNQIELVRQSIDSKAGDEQMENWSPLARAVAQPNRTLSYLHDIEVDTGSVILTAYRKLAHSLSYAINKAGKDGTHVKRPFREMINGTFGFPLTSEAYEDTGTGASIDGNTSLLNGSPMLFLKLQDSIQKYNTKADFLLQPRSFKMLLDTAKNSMGIFRTNPHFVKAMTNMDVFSTIDRDYDPTLPVMVSDFTTLVSPLNWANEFEVEDGVVVKSGLSYGYSDVRNSYITDSNHPLLEGIYNWFKMKAARIRDVSVGGSSEITINIPITYSLTSISAWELLVLSAIQEIEQSRIDSLREVLDFERAHGYPFSDLVKLGEVDGTGSKNFTFVGHLEPLKVGRMKPTTALTWQMPELFWATDEKADIGGQTFSFVLPWYFNESQFIYNSNGTATFEPLQATMSWPSSRDGLRFAPLDNIYALDERTARLSLDRMVRPLQVSKAANTHSVYKYDMTSDGLVVHDMGSQAITIAEFLKTPREVGYFIVSPYAYSSPKGVADSAFSVTASVASRFTALSDPFMGWNSYRARMFYGAGLENRLPTINDDKLGTATEINVNRGLNFRQNWRYEFASKQLIANYPATDIGILLSANDLLAAGSSAPIVGKTVFQPFFKGYVNANNTQDQLTGAEYEQVSFQKYLWTRLNVLPFAINPFDLGFKTESLGEDAVKYDIFDLLYTMNFVGFRSSDFTEDIYNKTNAIDQEKLLYLADPFVVASPIVE